MWYTTCKNREGTHASYESIHRDYAAYRKRHRYGLRNGAEAFGGLLLHKGGPMTFTEKVHEIVRSIPEGCVATYGQIALLLEKPGAARAVGFAMSRPPKGGAIPWHRVVRKDGALTHDASMGWEGLQKALLTAEGVRFTSSGHVNMRICLWRR